MDRITTVITMAGLGSRFRKAGYSIPKYQIEAHGKTLFDWSMESLKGYAPDWGKFIFVLRVEDKAAKFIADRCKALGILEYQLVEIDYLTDGQATTAILASPFWEKESPLLIYNIDTYVEAGEMKSSQLKGDGFIPCFHGDGDHWSFVKLNANGEAKEVCEKQRISDNCTLGAYYFKSCGFYKELYNDYYTTDGNLVDGEKYIAPLYNHLIGKGGKVYISDVPASKVHVLGTPEELSAFIGKNIVV